MKTRYLFVFDYGSGMVYRYEEEKKEFEDPERFLAEENFVGDINWILTNHNRVYDGIDDTPLFTEQDDENQNRELKRY